MKTLEGTRVSLAYSVLTLDPTACNGKSHPAVSHPVSHLPYARSTQPSGYGSMKGSYAKVSDPGTRKKGMCTAHEHPSL